jgi:O-antigen/teichoic acid export membrane protein
MSLFTNHDYTFNNMNMIFCSPVLLAAVPLGICYAFTKNQDKQKKYDLFLRLIWFLTAAGVLISMLLKIFLWFYQQNLTDQMLLLPIALVFAFQPSGLREAYQELQKWTGKK